MNARLLSIALLAGLGALSSRAAPSLNLSPSANLGTLNVGQHVTVSVILSGLDPGQELTFLGATVLFPADVFGAPASLSRGPIAPEPGSFFSIGLSGLADASYDDSTSRITSNGTFFTFDLHVLAEGAGEVAFDFTDALLFNPLDPGVPGDITLTAGAPLPVVSAVPEPFTASVLLPLLFLAIRRSRRVQLL